MAEAVVVGYDRDGVPAGLVVEDVAEPGVPDGALAVEAEVVLRLHLEGGLLRPGDAGQGRQLRVVAGVLRDRDALIARQRSDDDLGPVLFDQLADLTQDRVGGVIAAADPDQLDRGAVDLGAFPAVQGGGGRGDGRAGLVHQRQRHAGDGVLVEATEGALALAEDAQLHHAVTVDVGRWAALVGGVVLRFLGRILGTVVGGFISSVVRRVSRIIGRVSGLGVVGAAARGGEQ